MKLDELLNEAKTTGWYDFWYEDNGDPYTKAQKLYGKKENIDFFRKMLETTYKYEIVESSDESVLAKKKGRGTIFVSRDSKNKDKFYSAKGKSGTPELTGSHKALFELLITRALPKKIEL